MMAAANPHIVVLGAGFAGLTFCQKFRHPTARITLVDHHNHHLFQPLLYQVATAGLAAPDIAEPIRSILRRRRNVTVRLDAVKDIRLREKEVVLETTSAQL
jgi:NADH:ubiquinone reductase (H+-translocating)